MNKFTESTENFKIWSSIFTSAMFGTFITIGNAWSELIKSISQLLMPPTKSFLLGNLIFFVLTSISALTTLSFLVALDKKYKRVKKIEKKIEKKTDRQAKRQNSSA